MEQPPTSLSRELLRWIQSLDLAYSVKNVKRDFSNGFLIAEIFSRYYDKDIQMHSFDNGIALRIKKDNWGQLLKFLRTVGLIHLAPQEEVNAIIHCEDGAVVSFINRLYEALTQRKVQVVTKRPLPDRDPAYSRSTGAAAVRQTMRGSALAETSDELSRERKIREKIGEHERSLQEERSVDPERFSSGASAANKGMMRGPPRSVGAESAPVPQVQVKEIQVKQVDRSIAQIRASKEMSAGGGMSAAPAPAMTAATAEQIPTHGSQAASSAPAPAAAAGPSAMSVLNGAVARVISPAPASWDERREPIQNFVSALCDGDASADLPEGAQLDVLAEVAAQAPALAEACAGSPKQFWATAEVLTALVVDLPDGTAVFDAAVAAFGALGERMLKADAAATTGFFLDFALPRLLALLKGSAAKRVAVLRVLYAFVAPDVTSHINCIKRLQGLLDDLTAFLHCVTTLVFLEGAFDEQLLDLYMYYCVISMAQPSPTLRAASVAMLCVTLPQQPELLSQCAGQLLSMAREDAWWEVQAQLLALCGALLPALPGDDTLLAIADACFHPGALVAVRKVGLCALAGCMPDADAYCAVLLSLPSADRLSLLALASAAPAPAAPVLGVTAANLVIKPLPGAMDAFAVAGALKKAALEPPLENLEPEHVQLLAGCVAAQVAAGGALGQDWTELFDAMRDYVFVALCDKEVAALAAAVIEAFAFHSQLGDAVLREGRFLGILKLLHSEDVSDAECQHVVETMLRAMAQRGAPFDATVLEVLDQFSKASPDLFKASPLAGLLQDLH